MPIPRLRSYNVPAIQKLVDRITQDDELVALLGERLEKAYYRKALQRFRHYFPEAKYNLLQDTLLDLLGAELTRESLRTAAWRLAANRHRLKMGLAVPPWERQRNLEWVPLQCLSASRFYAFQRGKPSVMLRWRVLAGRPCPMIIQKRWPLRFCHLVARDIGFQRRNPLYVYRDFRELVGLRLYALLEPRLSASYPGFERIKCPPSCVDYNRQLILLRTRSPAAEFVCPKGYQHPCFRCHIGYEHCMAATHRRTYLLRHCARCKQQTWFDPDLDVGVCVECNDASFG